MLAPRSLCNAPPAFQAGLCWVNRRLRRRQARNLDRHPMDLSLPDRNGDSLTSVTSSPKPPLSTRRFPSNTNAFCCIRLMDNTACSSFYLCNYSFPLRASLPLPPLPPSNAFPFKSCVFKNKCHFFKTLETKGAVIQGEVQECRHTLQ